MPLETIRPISVASYVSRALGLINDGYAVTLDESDASAALARCLDHRQHLTVMTNAILVASLLTTRPGITVILLPGQLDRPSRSLITPPELQTLPQRSDLGFFGAAAYSADTGLMERTHQLARTKSLLNLHCRRMVAGMQSDAVDQVGPYVFAGPDQVTSLHVLDAEQHAWSRSASWGPAGLAN